MRETPNQASLDVVSGQGDALALELVGHGRGERALHERLERRPQPLGDLVVGLERGASVSSNTKGAMVSPTRRPLATAGSASRRPKQLGGSHAGRARPPRGSRGWPSPAGRGRAGSSRPPGNAMWPDHGSRGCSARRMSSTSGPAGRRAGWLPPQHAWRGAAAAAGSRAAPAPATGDLRWREGRVWRAARGSEACSRATLGPTEGSVTAFRGNVRPAQRQPVSLTDGSSSSGASSGPPARSTFGPADAVRGASVRGICGGLVLVSAAP